MKFLGILLLGALLVVGASSVAVSIWNGEPTLALPFLKFGKQTVVNESQCPTGTENLPQTWKITC